MLSMAEFSLIIFRGGHRNLWKCSGEARSSPSLRFHGATQGMLAFWLNVPEIKPRALMSRATLPFFSPIKPSFPAAALLFLPLILQPSLYRSCTGQSGVSCDPQFISRKKKKKNNSEPLNHLDLGSSDVAWQCTQYCCGMRPVLNTTAACELFTTPEARILLSNIQSITVSFAFLGE